MGSRPPAVSQHQILELTNRTNRKWCRSSCRRGSRRALCLAASARSGLTRRRRRRSARPTRVRYYHVYVVLASMRGQLAAEARGRRDGPFRRSGVFAGVRPRVPWFLRAGPRNVPIRVKRRRRGAKCRLWGVCASGRMFAANSRVCVRRPLPGRILPPVQLTPPVSSFSNSFRASGSQAGQGRQDHQEEPRGALSRSREGVGGGQGQGKAHWIRKEAWNPRGAFADQGPVDASPARAEASSEEVQGVEED